MEIVNVNFGKCNFLSVCIFSVDVIDHETHNWNWLSLKLLGKIFGLWIYFAGIEIGPEMVSLGLLNCFVALKFREANR